MSDIKDITEKYLRLVEIYADKNLDNNGAEAKQILTELATENATDYNTAIKLAKGKMTQMQKFAATNAERAISAARKNAPKAQQTQANQTQAAQAQATQQTTVADNIDAGLTQASTSKMQPKNNSSKVQRYELPSDVKADLHSYLYSKDDDYSDAVADYIDADGKSDKMKISHALNILDDIYTEFNKRPQPKAPKIDRQKLLNMTLMFYYSHNRANHPTVTAKAEKVVMRVSDVAAKDYLNYGKDHFLKTLTAAHQRTAPKVEDTEFIDKIVAIHTQDIFAKLENEEDKLKYAQLLRRNKLKQYIPEELADKLKKNARDTGRRKKDDNTSNPNTGDKPMTDEIKEETSTPAGAENTEDANKKNEPTFTLSKAQIWAAEHSNFDWKECKSVDEVMSKIEGAGYIVEGDKVLKKSGEGDAKEVVAEYDKDKDIMIDKEEDLAKEAFEAGLKDYPKQEELDKVFAEAAEEEELRKENAQKPALNTDALDKEEKKKEPEEKKPEELEQPLDWVQKKIRDYKAMETEGKISNVVINEELKTEFEAQVDGGTIHYSSPDNVSISNDAKIKTFEAVMMEPDNVGRPINFGENMPHDMAVRLVAACTLHGNKMQGNVPDLSAEDLQMLQSELGERFGEFQQKLVEQNKPKEEKKNDGKEEPKEQPKEEKAKISTVEELSKANESLKGIKEKFEQMKNDGLIAVSTNLETKKPEIVAGPALADKPKEEQEKFVNDANELIASAAAIVQSSKTVSGKLNEEQAQQNNKFNEERMQHLRDTMDQKKLAEHDALTPEARAERREKADKDMATKLGITPPEGDNKALSGAELDKYVQDNHINKFTYGRLHNKFNSGKEMTDAQKATLGKLPDAPKMERGAERGK